MSLHILTLITISGIHVHMYKDAGNLIDNNHNQIVWQVPGLIEMKISQIQSHCSRAVTLCQTSRWIGKSCNIFNILPNTSIYFWQARNWDVVMRAHNSVSQVATVAPQFVPNTLLFLAGLSQVVTLYFFCENAPERSLIRKIENILLTKKLALS